MKLQTDNPIALNIAQHLPATAQPLPLNRRLHLHEVRSLRHLHCPYYNSCLSIAALQHWESFICLYCPYYREESNDD